jgi:RNA polymerase sigma-70 factor (ECF subfamily)
MGWHEVILWIGTRPASDRPDQSLNWPRAGIREGSWTSTKWGRDDKLTRLTRAAAGNSDELCELVRPTQGDLWRFIAHLSGVQVADDLTQETYLRALRSVPTFGHGGPVQVWLLAIARHVVATHFDQAAREHRRRKRLFAQPADSAGADPGEALALGELIDSLSREHRDAFVLTQVLGLSYAQAPTVWWGPGRHHQVEGRSGPGPAHPRLRG